MFSELTAKFAAMLQERGIEAGRAYPRSAIPESGCYVRLAVDSLSRTEGAFARFLGFETGSDGRSRECYGMKCAMTLAIDIFASMDCENGAEACEAAMDEVILALEDMEGLRINSVSCSRARPDSDTGAFLCACRAELTLLLTARSEAEADSFSSFILKGEIK